MFIHALLVLIHFLFILLEEIFEIFQPFAFPDELDQSFGGSDISTCERFSDRVLATDVSLFRSDLCSATLFCSFKLRFCPSSTAPLSRVISVSVWNAACFERVSANCVELIRVSLAFT
jgi:hypothetical protein